MTFNPFLHCPKHRQLRDAYAIIGQWDRECGVPWQQHAPTHVDCEGLFITACSFNYYYYYYYYCCFFLFSTFCASQKCFSLYILVVYIHNFYIVGILQTAREEFHFTEKHASIVYLTINTFNLWIFTLECMWGHLVEVYERCVSLAFKPPVPCRLLWWHNLKWPQGRGDVSLPIFISFFSFVCIKGTLKGTLLIPPT